MASWKQVSFSDHTHSGYASTSSPTFTGTATFGGDIYGNDRLYLGTKMALDVNGTALYLGSTTEANKNETTYIRSNDENAISIDSSQNATFAGDVTLANNKKVIYGNAGENIYGDGTHLYITSSDDLNITGGGNTKIDTGGDIILDADGGDTVLKDGGTQYGSLTNTSGNLIIKSGSTAMLTGSGADATFAGKVYHGGSSGVLVDVNSVEALQEFYVQANGAHGLNFRNKTGTGDWQTPLKLNTDNSATFTGDISLEHATGGSPSIIFQRGASDDAYTDWKIVDSAGDLLFQQRGTDDAFTTNLSLSGNSAGGIGVTKFAGAVGIGIAPVNGADLHISGGSADAVLHFTSSHSTGGTGEAITDGMKMALDPENDRFYFWNYDMASTIFAVDGGVALTLGSSQSATFSGNVIVQDDMGTGRDTGMNLRSTNASGYGFAVNFQANDGADDDRIVARLYSEPNNSTTSDFRIATRSGGTLANRLTITGNDATFSGNVTATTNLTVAGDPATFTVDGSGSAYNHISKGSTGNWGALVISTGANTSSNSNWWIGLDDDGDDLKFSNYQFGTTYLSISKTNGATFAGTINGTTAILSTQLILPNGVAGTPAIRFADGDSGVYAPANGEVAISTNGTQRLNITDSTATFAGVVTVDQDSNADALYIDTEASSAHGININVPTQDTGNVIRVGNANSLTSGSVLHLETNGSDATLDNEVIHILQENASATKTVGLRIKQNSTAPSIEAGAGYMVNEQGRQDHVANTMPQPYYRLDGSNDVITISDNSNLSFGDGTTDNPFSVSMLFKINNTNSSNIIGKGVFNTDAEYICRLIDNKLYFVLHDESVSSCYIGRYYNTALSNDVWYHAVCTYNGNGTSAGCKIYINAVQADDTTNEGNPSSYVAMENLANPVEIGKYDSSYFDGEISNIKIWNKELTATEVKEDYSGASVPFKYKGANQTSIITGDSSNFAGGVGTWVGYSGGTVAAVSNWSSTAGNGLIKMTFDGSGNCGMSTNSTILTAGKRYAVSIKAKLYSGNSTELGIGDSNAVSGDNGTNRMLFTPTGTETKFTGEFTAGSAGKLYILDADANSGTEQFIFDDFTCTPIGAVAEYDGSGATSDVWYDKSGNSLNGKVTGATLENRLNILEIETEGTASPNSSGTTSSIGHALRIKGGSGGSGWSNSVLDIGVGDGKLWLQGRDKGNYATDLDILLNPVGGKVGIGVSVPAGDGLHISSSTSDAQNLVLQQTTNSDDQSANIAFHNAGGTNVAMIRGSFIDQSSNHGQFKFYTNDGGGNELALVIDKSQNVGIGTGSPDEKLHLHGADGCYLKITDDETGTNGDGLLLGLTTSQVAQLWVYEDQLNIATAGTQALGINSSQNATFAGNINCTGIDVITNNEQVVSSFINDGSGDTDASFVTIQAAEALGQEIGLSFCVGTSAISSLSSYNIVADVRGIPTNSSGDLTGDLSFRTNAGNSTDERMRISGSGNVGIGTGSPGSPLHIKSAHDKIQLEDSDSGNDWFIGTGNDADLYFAQASGSTDTRVTFKSGGNVGIGTGNPDAKLVLYDADGGDSTGIRIADDTSNLQIYNDTNHVSIIKKGSGGSAYQNIAFLDVNIGIGTSSPTDHYSDELVIACADEGGVTLVASAITHKQYISFARGTSGDDRFRGGINYDHNTDALALRCNGSDPFLINSSGFVGIGQIEPRAKLEITAGESGEYIRMSSPSAPTNYYNSIHSEYSATAGGSAMNFFVTTTTGNQDHVMCLRNQRLGVGTTNPVDTLDVNGDVTLGNTGGTTQLNLRCQDEKQNYIVFQDAGGTQRALIGSDTQSADHTHGDLQFSVGGSQLALVLNRDKTAEFKSTLTVAGKVQLTATHATNQGTALHLKSTGDHNWYLHPNGTTGNLELNYNDTVETVFDANGAVTFAGNVSISKASASMSVTSSNDTATLNLTNDARNFAIDVTDPTGGADQFQIRDVTGSGAVRMKIDTSGNATFSGDITVSGGDATISSSAWAGLAMKGGATAGSSIAGYYNAEVRTSIVFDNESSTATDGSIAFATGGNTNALTLDKSQNATFAGKITSGHNFSIPAEKKLYFNGQDGDTWIAETDDEYLDIQVGGVDLMRIVGDGAQGGQGVEVGASWGTTRTGALLVKDDTLGIEAWNTHASAGDQMRFYQGSSLSQVGSIATTTSGTAYNTSSDYRLKENITDMTGGVDRIKQLKPKRFSFKRDSESTLVDGLLAHEVMEVVPQAITGLKDEIDENDDPKYQSIDHSKLVPLLVQAVKELSARIEELESK